VLVLILIGGICFFRLSLKQRKGSNGKDCDWLITGDEPRRTVDPAAQ